MEAIPPLEDSSACISVVDGNVTGNSTSSKMMVRGTAAGARMRIRVGLQGRLVVRGTAAVSSDAQCGFPSMAPTAEPPTLGPSPAPTQEGLSGNPTQSPTTLFHVRCGSVELAYSGYGCVDWADPSSWTTNQVPTEGDEVIAKPALPSAGGGALGACVELEGDDAVASRLVVSLNQNTISASPRRLLEAASGRVRVRVGRGARLVVRGRVVASGDPTACAFPTPSPSVTLAPSSPTFGPSRAPTPLPSVRPSPAPTLSPTHGPSPAPTAERATFSCGAAALAYSADGEGGGCADWTDPTTWTSGRVPGEGDAVDAKPPPLPASTGGQSGGGVACVKVRGDDALASRVAVRPSLDAGRRARVVVGAQGRLVVRGRVAPVPRECLYPTPGPSVTPAPSAPTARPTHVPSTATPVPSPAPTGIFFSPTPGPTPLPTPRRNTHTCGAVVVALVDDEMACGAGWSETQTWLYGAVPSKGEGRVPRSPRQWPSCCCLHDLSCTCAAHWVLV